MKRSLLCLFAGVVLSAFVLAGCSSSSDEATGTITVDNLTGYRITALYIDPYNRNATVPTGQSKIASGDYLPHGYYISGALPMGDYMIYFEAAGDGYWLRTYGVNAKFTIEEDETLTVDIYSDTWEMYSNSRSADKTVIASGTVVKAL